MKFLRTVFILSSITFMGCCTSDKVEPLKAGTYSGVFNVKYGSESYSGKTSLTFENARFSSTSGQNRFPAGGSGVYTISNDKIVFTDQNFWTADFDWGLILSGTYTYSFDGKRLTLKKQGESSSYEYVLEKVSGD
ncbi:hypothetical protein NF867_05410 [Solitalea sp. MAHUQ-68]|uniref:Lipocalin-like domain-containing protein n=1 Tax=Solitalea agri TaxID=2953739 RepID=A0A9X2JBA9_9SPHI|nr:hypothetical protein [Solitalea agri]MCO4292297.1 hypothetical protein [Solitalea agri]